MSAGGLLLVFGLLVGGPARTQEVEVDVEQLRAWAEARAEESRMDQVALRFGPLTERLRGQGLLDEATELLRTWFELSDGASVPAARGLVEILLERERFEELLAVVSRHRTRADEDAFALEAALATWELGRLEDAEAEFETALQSSEAAGGLAEYQWARFLAWSGRSAESWSRYESLLQGRFGASADVVLDAARACTASLAAGACTPPRAVELAQRAVELLPEHTGAHYNLVRALEAAGSEERARAATESVRALLAADQQRTRARGRSQARAAAAELRLREGDAASAVELLCGGQSVERCLTAEDWRGEQEGLALARVLWAAGERRSALMLLERLVASDPTRVDWRGLLFAWRRDLDRTPD